MRTITFAILLALFVPACGKRSRWIERQVDPDCKEHLAIEGEPCKGTAKLKPVYGIVDLEGWKCTCEVEGLWVDVK